MGGLRKKKYQSGEGARYMTRNRAKKYLQLSLNEFRTLCILKGIYPREPRNRKKAQQGATDIKTLYYKKDIQFLSHEPNMQKLREFKVLYRKIRKAKGLRNDDQAERLRGRFPELKLDHIVKERYPTFIDALRDLDDCLTLLFMYAGLPRLRRVPERIVSLCRRLTVEFMHYVIAAKALKKVFISIKGYYYQAEIKGQTVTWIVPHRLVTDSSHFHQIDMRIMTDFVDFYMIMLGFVNFRLYHSLNLVYPPTFPGYSAVGSAKDLVDEESYAAECVAALNIDLARIPGTVVTEEEEEGIEEFPIVEDQEKLEELKKEMEKKRKLKTLFKGLKFFINREVPREPLVFVIRCLGGAVSWSRTSFIGATYDESDETITHQIVDRPQIDKQYISRYYVQPQWIFDSVNACQLLPVEKYFIGAILPPHLSPFQSEHKLDQYIPPEEAALTDPEYAENLAQVTQQVSSDEDDIEDDDEDEEDENDDDDEEDEDEDIKMSGEESEGEAEKMQKREAEKMKRAEKEREGKKKMMKVKAGEIYQEDPFINNKQKREEYQLRVSMIHNKHRKLYHSMVKGRKKRDKEAWLLRKKRVRYEEEERQKRKLQRKQEEMAHSTQASTSV